MNELITPHNVGVKNALENMKEVLALYKKVIGNYRLLLDGERYLTDREVAQILKVSRRTLHSPKRACSPVLAHTFLLVGNVLVESTQQRFVLAAETLIGIAHNLCRYESLAIRKVLIVFDDLRLDIIQFAVNLQCLLAAALGTIALHVPHVNASFGTICTINRHNFVK